MVSGNMSDLPIRYTLETVRLTLRQMIAEWWRGIKNRQWIVCRTVTVFRAVYPGEAGYDVAPCEMSLIHHPSVLEL